MSTARIDKLLREGIPTAIPVPHIAIDSTNQDPFSKRLRKFDNLEIKFPYPDQSGVYVNTNEQHTKQTFSQLTNYPHVEQAIHIGFSGWYNFDIVAQRKSSRAFICDLNPENALFLNYTLKYLKRYPEREQFIEKMTYFVKENHYNGSRTTVDRGYLDPVKPNGIKFSFNISEEYPDHSEIYEEIALETKRENSWLYTRERYFYIRKLALNDKISVIAENICTNDVFFSIRRLLTDNSIEADTIYVSNIAEWMFTEEQQRNFLATINSLLTNENIVN